MINDNKYEFDRLRQNAEELLKNKTDIYGVQFSESDTLELIHDLEVHQIELEMQNEELLRTRASALKTAEKYSELYDFSPSGYFTFSKVGEILKLNLRGANMLGMDKSQLLNTDFVLLISEKI